MATINFVIFSLAGGDPSWSSNPEELEALRTSYGFYDPLLVKYAKYLRNMFTFGIIYPYFGWSTRYNQFVAEGLYWRLPITLYLLGTSLVGSMTLGILWGVFAASRRGTKTDVAIMGSALLTWATPIFMIQILAISFFGLVLRDTFGITIFATTWGTPNLPTKTMEWWAGVFSRLTLPILTQTLVGLGSWILYTRNLLLDALTQDYVITARAKGLTERAILYKHTFKALLPPIATLITLSIPAIVTGSIITENLFGIEGIGRWYIVAVRTGDWNIVTIDHAVAAAVFFIFAVLVVSLNLIADLLYGIFDPRIRVGDRR